MSQVIRILVIEDNLANMELVVDLLELNDFEVYQAVNAEDGIEIAREILPDYILMDIQLPGMDGLTATGILKENEETSGIKIIALTSHAISGYEEKVFSAGCNGYITKPINTRTIASQILAIE